MAIQRHRFRPHLVERSGAAAGSRQMPCHGSLYKALSKGEVADNAAHDDKICRIGAICVVVERCF
jgi:hypothetical protein